MTKKTMILIVHKCQKKLNFTFFWTHTHPTAYFERPILQDGSATISLSVPLRANLRDTLTWLNSDGSLNPDQLLDTLSAFLATTWATALGQRPYYEIAPHLVLMAFLHRVVNGGGALEREYAIGRGRMDLCLRYGAVTLGMELKVWRADEPDPLTEGLTQLDGYLAGLGLDSGWLVIFDRRSGQPPIRERTSSAEKQSPQTASDGGAGLIPCYSLVT